jgi:RNA polymerase sigma factor (sigma-70 family)
MRFSEQSDENLLKETAAGRFSAFEELLERHQQRLMNFYWRMTGSPALAAQLFEETWADLYKLRGSQAASSGVGTALFALATRKAVSLVMQRPPEPAQEPLLHDSSSLESRSQRLNQALLRLPLKERAALLLGFFDSLNFHDTAACLNEREEHARELAAQGLKRLLEALGPEFFSVGFSGDLG